MRKNRREGRGAKIYSGDKGGVDLWICISEDERTRGERREENESEKKAGPDVQPSSRGRAWNRNCTRRGLESKNRERAKKIHVNGNELMFFQRKETSSARPSLYPLYPPSKAPVPTRSCPRLPPNSKRHAQLRPIRATEQAQPKEPVVLSVSWGLAGRACPPHLFFRHHLDLDTPLCSHARVPSSGHSLVWDVGVCFVIRTPSHAAHLSHI